jgi:chemotaxis signal transduction protein
MTDRAAAGGSNTNTQLLLIVRVGSQRYALPAAAVERILPMAALTPLPGAPRDVAGLLNLHGEILPVVDPRPHLAGVALANSAGSAGSAPAEPDTSQHLVVVVAQTRYLLWVDAAEQVFAPSALSTAGVVRLGDAVVPVLFPESLDPGPLLATAGAAAASAEKESV